MPRILITRRTGATALAVGIGAVVTALALSAVFGTGERIEDVATRLDTERLGDSVLIVAPHPDDETLAPGGLIAQLRRRGAKVTAVVLTSGDGFKRAASLLTTGPLTPEVYRELGRLRHAESDRALAAMDVAPADRIFLCYADGSLNTMWDRDWDPAHPHPGLNGATSPPYPYAYQAGRVYCGANLADDLRTLIEQRQPSAIVYPDANDTHHDHWAAAAFTEYAMAAARYGGARFSYLVHFGTYPSPWGYEPQAWMLPPAELRQVGTRWWSLPLDDATEREKDRTIGLYRSQLRLSHMDVYLHAFVRRNELFGTYAPASPLREEISPEPPEHDTPGDVVVLEPRLSGVASLMGPPRTVSEVRMARTPETVWLGVTTFRGSVAGLRHVVGVRLFGPDDAPSRLDITVAKGVARAARVAHNSVVPSHIDVRVTERTVWVGVPAEVFAGRDRCLVAGAALPPRARARGFRSAWRPVKL